jgi:hypothetical protein
MARIASTERKLCRLREAGLMVLETARSQLSQADGTLESSHGAAARAAEGPLRGA